MVQPLWKTILQFKLNVHYSPVILLLNIYPKEMTHSTIQILVQKYS